MEVVLAAAWAGKDLVTVLTKTIMRFALSIPSLAVDNYLFVEELDQEGVAGQTIGLVKAMVIWVMLVHLSTCFHHPPTSFTMLQLGNLCPVTYWAS